MWLIIIPLAGGYILAASRPGLVARWPVVALTNASLVLLLMVMGARIGADPDIIGQLGSLGLTAFVLAGTTTLGSILALCLVQAVLPGTAGFMAQGDGPQGGGRSLTLLLLASVLAGLALGVLVLPPGAQSVLGVLTPWLLGLLLFGIGLDLGGSGRALVRLRQLGPGVLLVPAAVIAGSLLGALVVLIWPVLAWPAAAAVASGFGWYSLSSVLISPLDPALGALAFMANVFRELIAVVITPAVARALGPVPALGPAGATAMDVLLPVIAKGAGREYVPLAFFTGAVLSLSVPVFVNLFMSML